MKMPGPHLFFVLVFLSLQHLLADDLRAGNPPVFTEPGDLGPSVLIHLVSFLFTLFHFLSRDIINNNLKQPLNIYVNKECSDYYHNFS